MGFMLKRNDLITFIKDRKYYDGSEIVLWGNVKNTRGAFVVLIFNQTGLLTLSITPSGKIEDSILITEHHEIRSVRFKKGILSYKLMVDSVTDDVPPFHVNKMMIGYKPQQEELDRLLNKYS